MHVYVSVYGLVCVGFCSAAAKTE